ncbi:DUF4232 domain-containing protein [Streptomyces sp. NPDC090085]|uniref:DUF4232 domain-containing protein n=1 Tax=unclassified Streptomyces TaxID=2593676 RepID=UPI003440F1DD
MSTVRRSAAALVLAAASAFALTACGPSGDDAAGSPGAPTGAAPAASATPAGTPAPAASPTPSKAAKTAKPAGSSTASTPPGPDHDVFPCSTADVTFTASLAEPTTSSYLLKVTNKSGKACRVLGHPVVTFGSLDGQAAERGAAPGIEDAIRLEPGRTAYAGLMGGLDDGSGKTVNSIALTMNTESDLVQTPLTASTPGFRVVPDKNFVSPWTDNAEDALSLP